jgi:hypothetical protein
MNMHNQINFASNHPMLVLGLATSAALGIMSMLPSQATAINLTGDFAPSNWTLTNTEADGSVETNVSSGTIILTGGNNGSTLPGTTDWTISINSAGNISFNWSYSTLDTPGFDSAGYLMNGDYTPLAIQDGDFSTSPVSVNVNIGDIFGFRAATSSNSDGPPVFSVFVDPVPVPWETDALPVVGSTLLFGIGIWKKYKSSNSNHLNPK